MSKRVQSQINQVKSNNDRLKFSLLTISLIIFCSFMIVIATFTQLSFYHYTITINALLHPINFLTQHNSLITLKYYEYIPQIPVIIYIATLLGPKFGMISVLIYIILGLTFLPIFALGGGPGYLFQYNFGYILAYLPAVFVVYKSLKNNYSYKNMAKASLWSVLTIHILGIFYILALFVVKRESFNYIINWVFIQSISKILYDFIFSFLAILMAKLTKKFLWITMG